MENPFKNPFAAYAPAAPVKKTRKPGAGRKKSNSVKFFRNIPFVKFDRLVLIYDALMADDNLLTEVAKLVQEHIDRQARVRARMGR